MREEEYTVTIIRNGLDDEEAFKTDDFKDAVAYAKGIVYAISSDIALFTPEPVTVTVTDANGRIVYERELNI